MFYFRHLYFFLRACPVSLWCVSMFLLLTDWCIHLKYTLSLIWKSHSLFARSKISFSQLIFKWQYTCIKLKKLCSQYDFKLHSSVNVFWCAEQNPVCDDVPLENLQPASSNLICQQYFCKQNAQKWKWVYTYITWVHGNFLWFDSIS